MQYVWKGQWKCRTGLNNRTEKNDSTRWGTVAFRLVPSFFQAVVFDVLLNFPIPLVSHIHQWHFHLRAHAL